jgi:hypothetical protein
MKKNLAKLYDQLTGIERLRLVIEAEARGDDAEVDNLVRSCPRKHFSCGDDAYTVPLKATWELVQAACHDFDRYMGRLQALDVVQCMISGLIEHLHKFDKIPRKRIEDIVATLEGFSEAPVAHFRVAILAEIKGLYEAFGKFFQGKLDLTSDALLKAYAKPYWEWLDRLKEEISGIEVDPEIVAKMEKQLDKSWNLRIE